MNLELTIIEQIIVRQALEAYLQITEKSLPTTDNKEITYMMLSTIVDLIKRTKE